MQNTLPPIGTLLQQAVTDRLGSDWLIVDNSLRMVYCNNAFLRRWKLTNDEAIGNPLPSTFSGTEDAQLWLWAFEDALSKGKDLSGVEVQIQSRPAITWAYTWTKTLQLPGDPASPYVIGTFIEINQYKKLETKLARVDADIIKAFSHAMDMRDSYTSRHSDSVAELAELLAKHLRQRKAFVNDCRMAGYMHDLGKLLVPRGILNKPGRLNDEEFSLVQKHPEAGSEIIADIATLQHLSPGILAHHERWDGTGYPNKLKGEGIPLLGRILAICDSYHAMISHRTYKDVMNPVEALDEISRCAGHQFDPALATAFVKMMSHTRH